VRSKSSPFAVLLIFVVVLSAGSPSWGNGLAAPRLLFRDGPIGKVTQVAWSPAGNLVAEGCEDGAIALRDPATGAVVRRLDADYGVIDSVAFAPDGQKLVTAGDIQTPSGMAATADVWDCRTGRRLLELPRFRWKVNCATFAPNGLSLLTLSRGQPGNRFFSDLQVWNASTGRLERTISFPDRGALPWTSAPLSFSPDGKILAVALMEIPADPPRPSMPRWQHPRRFEIRLFRASDLAAGEVIAVNAGNEKPRNFVWSADSKLIAAGYSDDALKYGCLCLWSVRTGKLLAKLRTGPKFARNRKVPLLASQR